MSRLPRLRVIWLGHGGDSMGDADDTACPFCWTSTFRVITLAPGMQVVLCGTCHAQGPVGATHDEAIRNWTLHDGCVQARCPVCSGTFRRPYAQPRMYCSAQCRTKAAAARQRERHQERQAS